MQLVRGQKVKLSDLTSSMQIELQVRMRGNGTYDVTCFGLDQNGKLSDDRFFVFFNQLSSPDNCINKLPSVDGIDKFSVNFQGLSPHVKRMVFTVAIEGAGTMSDIIHADLTIVANAKEVASLALTGADFAGEKAVMLAEIYLKDAWRFAAVGQGFNGGLSALLKHFGGEEVASPQPSTPPVAKATTPPPIPAAPKKVSLQKANDTAKISLSKTSSDRIVVKAQWVDNGDDSDENDDLDLRAGVLLPDGKMYWLDCSYPGNINAMPFARHMGDVQSASAKAPGEETIEVNPHIAVQFDGRPVAMVFSVYSAVGNGVVSVASLRPRMRIQYQNQVVECCYDFNSGPNASREDIYTYVIGLAIISPDSVVIRPSGVVSEPSSEATPWLTWAGGDVRLTMNGPVVMKDRDSSEYNRGNSYRYANVS